MEIRLIAIGRRMPGWVASGFEEYARRLPSHLRLELIEVEARARGGDVREAEARALLDRAPEGALVVALDGRGEAWSTAALASRLGDWQQQARAPAFLVGGAGGHPDWLLERAERVWSLGPLTLPHMLIRVIVAEQLYRAHTILAGHPYHRG